MLPSQSKQVIPERKRYIAELEIERDRLLAKPTHICMDCGEVGNAGGYHDHGDGQAGDVAEITVVLDALREAATVLNERDNLRASLTTALAWLGWDRPDSWKVAEVARMLRTDLELWPVDDEAHESRQKQKEKI